MLAIGIILFVLCLLFLLVLVWRAYQVETRPHVRDASEDVRKIVEETLKGQQINPQAQRKDTHPHAD